mmetsp:Transcript_76857/g.197932  ORF Transcript_76857/g.197932 Transcript_76857/m.197932 type:complete len:297 (-) Transcript_76857:310-1200(-)
MQLSWAFNCCGFSSLAGWLTSGLPAPSTGPAPASAFAWSHGAAPTGCCWAGAAPLLRRGASLLPAAASAPQVPATPSAWSAVLSCTSAARERTKGVVVAAADCTATFASFTASHGSRVLYFWIRHSLIACRTRSWISGVMYSRLSLRLRSLSLSSKKGYWISGKNSCLQSFSRRCRMVLSAVFSVTSSQPIFRSSSRASSEEETILSLSLVFCLIKFIKTLRTARKAGGTSTMMATFRRRRHWPSIMPARATSGFGFRKWRAVKPPPKSIRMLNPFAPGLFRSNAVQTEYSICGMA